MLTFVGVVIPWGVYDDVLWTNPTVVGLILAIIFPMLILGNKDRALTKSHRRLLLVVCLIFATHGIWWEWYWIKFSLRVDDVIVFFAPSWKSWWYIDPVIPPAVFGGLMFLTLLLMGPVWILTRSRWTMLMYIAAAVFPGALFVRWGHFSMWYHGNMLVPFVTHPVNSWFVLTLIPLARLAHVSQREYPKDRCRYCQYSFEGLDEGSKCPECGAVPAQ